MEWFKSSDANNQVTRRPSVLSPGNPCYGRMRTVRIPHAKGYKRSSKDLMKGLLVGAIASSIVMISASALAGTGIGGVFNLGKTNKVNAQTTLTGTVKGKSLQLTNNGSGPALGITVGAGKAPLVASANAGMAINLNADKPDGHDSSYFATTGFSAGFTDSNPV